MRKSRRAHIPKSTETDALFAARRRCCLCLYIDGIDEEQNGQLAHLNRSAADPRFDNLVWLCTKHHDAYDTRRSQTKGYTPAEVRRYRDRLYKHNKAALQALTKRAKYAVELRSAGDASAYVEMHRGASSRQEYLATPWRYPLWLEAERPSFFAFKARNRLDGVCLIERVDLPDGRIVIACIQVAGNPGNSITNSAEYICDQVCRRFSIPPEKLVWLEHYDLFGGDEWKLVTFGVTPPVGEFAKPKWTMMMPALWRGLWLKPKRKLKVAFGSYESKLRKLFPWPPEGAEE
jgi:hypothetical protein